MSSPKQLSTKVRFILERENCLKFLSIASVWELATKASLKKLMLPESLEKFLHHALQDLGLKILPIELEQLFLLAELPFVHRDPFDRLLIVQAKHKNLIYVGADRTMKRYQITAVW